ncbi:MAG: hypothetical protein U0235_08460 [Polyangiaceae bacterium]
MILTVATGPLLAAVLLARSMFSQASAVRFNPEVGHELDRGVELYKDYVKALKDDMRHQTDALAADETLREAARKKNVELLESELDVVFPRFPELVALRVTDESGQVLAKRDRGRPRRRVERAEPRGRATARQRSRRGHARRHLRRRP